MKFPLQRNTIILLVMVGLISILAISLDGFGIVTLMEKSESAEQLASRRGNNDLAGILGVPNGLAGARKEIQEWDKLGVLLSQKEETYLGPWKKATLEAKADGQDWARDPNKWKDQLVKWNDDVLKRSGKSASSKSVVLMTNFYLGLENFKQKSPKDDQVPELALQLSVSKRLVDLMFQAKETSLEGYPTPCTLIKLRGPLSQQAEGVVEPPPKDKKAEKNSLQRDHYTMEFTCSPEVLFYFILRLTKDDYFFVPTNLNVTNEKEGFPKRSQLAGQFSVPDPATVALPESSRRGDQTSVPPLLKILAGDEKLRVILELDFIEFPSTEAGKTGGSMNPT